jgi:UDP-3-O-[3-hydroxymyristoyl] glucosamine N-acyltransferase LpxD
MTWKGIKMSILSIEIAKYLNKKLQGENITINNVCSINKPSPNSLSFIKKRELLDKYKGEIPNDILIIIPRIENVNNLNFSYIMSENPRLDFAKAVSHFFAPITSAQISSSAQISATAIIGENVSIGPFSIIGEHVKIGDNTVIKNNVYVHNKTTVGQSCVIKSFSVIGEEGFGFDFEPDGTPFRLPHLGSVIIEDNVEVGNFCTICRGTIDPTVIRKGTKIDDHCHIAHNVQIGENVIITACAEVSGSVQIDNQSWIGPNASILNGVKIETKALVGIGAVVIRDIETNKHVLGNPARKTN